MKKVVVTGPESTGKSTLSSLLADHYNTLWVPEYAREYINKLGRTYQETDLLEIARGQLAKEDTMADRTDKLLICDTDMIVIKIWAEHKYGHCSNEIIEAVKSRKYDLHLLTYIDLPWQEDPQRENPHLRQYFYDLFKKELQMLNFPYVEIRGNYEQRKQTAIRAIDRFVLS